MAQSETIPSQKQLLKIAIPGMLAALAVPVAELTDLAFLGHLDDVNQLSGVVLAIVIFDYIFWSFGFLRMGTTGLVAQALGTEDEREQANLFWRAFLLALAIGATLTLLQNPIGELGFSLLAGGEGVEQAGRDYYQAHIWGSIPTLVNYACVGWLLGRGRAGMVLIVSMVCVVTNILLDYWFIILLGWQAAGAGYAIMLAEWLGMFSAVICVVVSWGGIPHFHKAGVLNWEKARLLMALNSAILVRTFLLISVLAAFTNISATFGAVVLAANAILLRLWTTAAYVIDGFAIALETLGGQYYGQKNRPALCRSFRLTVIWNIAISLFFILTYWFGADLILAIMTDHTDVIIEAKKHLLWLVLALLAGGAAFIYDGLFLGLAKPGLLLRSMMVSCTVFAVPAAIALHLQSIDWLWLAMLLFLTARAVTLSIPARKYLQTK